MYHQVQQCFPVDLILLSFLNSFLCVISKIYSFYKQRPTSNMKFCRFCYFYRSESHISFWRHGELNVHMSGTHFLYHVCKSCSSSHITDSASICASSSAVNVVFSSALMLSRICAGLEAPISTDVTAPSLRIQASAISASVWPLLFAISLRPLTRSIFSAVRLLSLRNLLSSDSGPSERPAQEA